MIGFWRIPALLLVLTGLVGCSKKSEDAAPLSEQIQIKQFVSSLEDVKKNPTLLARWFADGAAPPTAELRKYAKYATYRSGGDPKISGDNATMKVSMMDADDKELGQMEWTFVRQGGQWKLKSAPLP